MSKTIRPEQLAGEIEQLLTRFHQHIGNESQKAIIANTPVQSGSLRASIQANLNAPKSTWSKDQTDPSGAETISNNSQVIAAAKITDSINIATAAPYAAEVELGTAQRAPAGMFTTAANSVPAFARSFTR